MPGEGEFHYTYAQYQREWVSLFGEDAVAGDYGYYTAGEQYHPYPVRRLSEREFEETLDKLNVASQECDAAIRMDNGQLRQIALARMLPAQLLLLL